MRIQRDRGQILVGDVLEKLREVPDNSVHCCVTSPPYFGLRDYGGIRRWFGGDPACEHDATIEHGPHHPGQVAQTKWQDVSAVSDGQTATTTSCSKCGAWLGQLGLEPTPAQYVENMVQVFREVKRVLRPDGTCWLNLGDSYVAKPYLADNPQGLSKKSDQGTQVKQSPIGLLHNRKVALQSVGLKPKDLIGIPWRVAFALQDDGWWLRSDIIWAKNAVMPESVTDRPTKSHEYIFLLTKAPTYFYDREAILEPLAEGSLGRYEYDFGGPKAEQLTIKEAAGPGSRTHPIGQRHPHAGRNKRTVWHINPRPYPEAHFATFPPEIPQTCIKAGTSEKGACPTCGAPWARITEKQSVTPMDYEGKWANTDEQSSGRRLLANARARRLAGEDHEDMFPAPVTIGWQPTCQCPEHKPVPCVVLDPFSGSGTTLAVAAGLSRHYIGIELNPEYIKLIEKRLDEPENFAHQLDIFDALAEQDDETIP